MADAKTIKVTLVGSAIGATQRQRADAARARAHAASAGPSIVADTPPSAA